MDINTVTIYGRVGKDPEIRRKPGGSAVVNFSIANSVYQKDKATGEWKEKTNWFDVTVFGDSAERFAERARKGDGITVTGVLEQRTWKDKEDNRREKVGIVARGIQYHVKKRPNEDRRNYGEAVMRDTDPDEDY